jgi:peptidyl-prolyl cis-trans isomerase B (cyclophilin B)
MKTLPHVLLIVATITAGSMISRAQTFTGKPQYQIEVKRADTVMGKITVEMFPTIAPNHVRNWDTLVAAHFFDSIAFHRVIPNFMIQGGDPNSRSGDPDTWGYGGSEGLIDAEFSAVSHRRGILSAARLGNDINSASSQFFICVANRTDLDRDYSVYGKVISGMHVADSIVRAERDGADRPYDKITMFITRLGSNDSLTGTPQLVSPDDAQVLAAAPRVTCMWQKISDAMLYNVEVASEASFTNIISDTSMNQLKTSVAIELQPGTYYWRVQANNGGNISEYSEVRSFTLGSLAVDEDLALGMTLGDAYPNPLQSEATISFSLEQTSIVSVSVLDVFGQEVRTLLSAEHMSAGPHEVTFAKDDLAAGMYFYRLEAEGRSITKRMIVQ